MNGARRFATLAAVLVGAGVAHAQQGILLGSVAAPRPELKYVNVVSTFLQFWDQTKSDSDAVRVRRFREIVIAPHPC